MIKKTKNKGKERRAFIQRDTKKESMNNGRKIIADEEKLPCLVKWAERFECNPNVKGLIPETEELIEFANDLRMKLKAAASAKK